MIAETGVGCLIAIAGFGAVLPSARVPSLARVWLSVPIGMALYLFVSLGLVIVTGTLDPGLAIGLAVVLGGVGLVAATFLGTLSWADLKGLGLTVAIAAVTVVAARVIHLTRVSPDSLRYLLAAGDLLKPDALSEMHRADLLIRQIGLPSLHAMFDLIDRRYMASIAPLFGVYGLGLFVWFVSSVTAGETARSRRWLLLSSTLFLVTSNRLVYDSFYINTHIQMASFMLIAVVGFWLAVTRESTGWALSAGISMAAMVLLRPEAPLVVAVILVALAASRANWPVRVLAVFPVSAVMAMWYGVVLWEWANYGDLISITAPVFGSLIAVFGSVLVVVLTGNRRLRDMARLVDVVALVGIAGLVAVFGVKTPQVLIDSLVSTAQNLTYHGLWLLTWCAAVALLLVALVVQRIDESRLWSVPIVGFGLLFWLLPLIREGAWRVGAGDSGNRILAHILSVVVGFLVLAAIEPKSAEGAQLATVSE